MTTLTRRTLAAVFAAAFAAPAMAAGTRPLPSWRDGSSRERILEFLARATTAGDGYVPPSERIAVFDNDGTLWTEAPMYVQARFLADRVAALVEANPALREQQPYKAVIDRDLAALTALGEPALLTLIDATHAGMTLDAFAAIARDWIDSKRDARFGRLYRELVFQPQLELLAHLRDLGFKTFIVSGGGVEFMRAFAERAYGIPPEQVIGSSGRYAFEMQDGEAVILKSPGLGSNDDKAGKPANIALHIGRRPVVAVGNSDGDLQMLQYATTGKRPGLGVLIHHDDARREYAYDRGSKVGALDTALDEAARRGWVVVSMKSDWSRIFPFEPPA